MLWQSVCDGVEMNDLHQKPALSQPPPPPPPPPPPSATSCSSNGGLVANNIDMNSSSNCNFSSSATSAVPLSSPPYPWGTWEDLLLASAVLKHGIDNWATVSCELQARAFLVPPSLFSAEACKGRFWILNGHFSSCSNGTIRDGKIPWFEEVRKLRVAQLKRELERYDGSIGLLQKKLNRLKAEKGGAETLISKDICEQDNLRSADQYKAERCLQVCSAGDRMPAEQPFGTLSEGLPAPGAVETSCITTSPVINAVGGVQYTDLVPDMKESLTVENANSNASSGVLISEGILDQHLTTLEGCYKSDSINDLATIGVHHETLETQVGPCSILEVKMSSSRIQDADHESHIRSDALSSNSASESCELADRVVGAQVNHVPAIGAVEKVLQREAFQYDTREMDNGTHKSEDAGLSAEDTGPLCSPAGVERSVGIDRACMESNQCQELSVRSATHSGNMSKKDSPVEESLLSASAMDLLRIAYADGTPVSTPEATEAQPVEPEKTEESEGIKEVESLCPAADNKLFVHQSNLTGSSVVEARCKDTVAEPESTEQNKTLVIQQTALLKIPSSNALSSVMAREPDLAFALEPEHASEQIFQVEGLSETSTVLSKTTKISNFGDGLKAEKADTGPLQNVEEKPYLVRSKTYKLELDNNCSAGEEGKSEVQDSGKWELPDNIQCSQNLVEEISASSAARACSEMVEEKVEEDSEQPSGGDSNQEVKSVATITDVTLPVEVEKSVSNPDKFGNLSMEHPARLIPGIDEASQVVSSGSQLVVELKKRQPIVVSAKDSGSEISGLAVVEQAISKNSDPIAVVHNSLHEADIQVQKASSCDSNGRSSIVEEVDESINKQQEFNPEVSVPDRPLEANNEIQKAKCSNVEGKLAGVETEANMQAKLEGGIVQMLGSKSSSVAGLSIPVIKSEHSADIDVLEEDGLLVDLMKLKGTDLTTLRKRKLSNRIGNSVETTKDYGAPKERLDEIVMNKQPKLFRSREENKIEPLPDAALNKDLGKSKNLKLKFCSLDGSSDNLGHAALSSNVSISELHDKSGSKESAVEVFSTRRSRLKLRKLEPSSEEPHKMKKRKGGFVRKSEDMGLDVGDEDASQLEISGVIFPDGKPVIRMEMSTDNRLLPDLLILLECLRMISGHRFAPLFKLRPEIKGDARYRGLVKRHMDLNTVRKKLEEGSYSGNLEFFRDMMLIFSNALVFYSRESQEYGAARVLRENLIREMDRFLKNESPHGSPAAALQAVRYSESKVLKDLNMSSNVATSEGKRQGSIRSSCEHTNCEVDLEGEVDTSEVTLSTKICAQDYGLGKSILDWKKKDQEVKVSSKGFSRAKTTRTKVHEVEDDRLNILPSPKERVTREKHSRNLEDMNAKLSIKRDSGISSQELKRPHQISSRSAREYTPKREPSDKSRISKDTSGRQPSVLQGRQGEPRKSLGGGRSSRSSQQSKQTYSRGNPSFSQPQKRART